MRYAFDDPYPADKWAHCYCCMKKIPEGEELRDNLTAAAMNHPLCASCVEECLKENEREERREDRRTDKQTTSKKPGTEDKKSSRAA